MADIERILIVGGGIGGLTVATALHRQGFEPELIERSAAWPAIGAGIFLPANGVRVLQALGLDEAVDRAAVEVRRWSFFDQQGELLSETDLRDLWREVGPCLGITRVKLQEARLAGAGAVPHRLGVKALTQQDSSVVVRFSDGTHRRVRSCNRGGRHPFGSARARRSLLSSQYAGQVVRRGIIHTRPRGMAEMMGLMGEKSFFGLVPMGEGHT
jgi:2-polyprenyl-6-methoxyphenol hydroxylase-like FAD-dependent oxidoreductase